MTTSSAVAAIIASLSTSCASEWMSVSSLETMTLSTESTWTLAHGDREAFEAAVLDATGEKPSRDDVAAFDRALQRSLDDMIEAARSAARSITLTEEQTEAWGEDEALRRDIRRQASRQAAAVGHVEIFAADGVTLDAIDA